MNWRLTAVRERLAAAGLDALLVNDLTNIRWLSGFRGSNGWLVVSADSLVFVTDGRYGEQAQRQAADAGVRLDVLVGLTGAAVLEHTARCIARFGRVGFESAHLTVLQHEQHRAAVARVNPECELVPVVGIVESSRRAKDDGEIASIVRACRIADQALADVVPWLVGLTEIEVRNRLESRMRELGASGPSYETIVATGPVNGALPHHRPTDTVIEPGHLVVIDVGALVDGYHSDMTRTFVVGEPSAEQRERYQLVLDAQLAGLAAVRAGASAASIDHAARSVIEAAGLGDWFSHGTGHGVGLLIHEDPFVSRASDAILQVGDVVTVEPGVYHEGFGGIRVEDLVVVTPDGCRVLTSSAKDSPCPPLPPTT